VLPRNKIVLIFLFVVFIMFFGSPLYAEDKNFILNFYKNHISVVDGNRCPMYLSCSSYASRAFEKHGPVLGWIMSCDRLVRCGRDEADVSEKVIVNSHQLIHDPVAANDFWWFEKDKNR
jgi:putative component of membrane protein insertase Oxa1/YidC/SpoIIIJ protein YidD